MGIFDGYLLVTDMDGTLLNDDRKISEENLEAIKYFISEGGKFTIATGRTVESAGRYIHKYFNEIHIGVPVGLYNGGKIYDYDKKETVWEAHVEECDKQSVKNIKLDYPNLGLEVYSGEHTYVYNECKFTRRLEEHYYEAEYNVGDWIMDKQWIKALIIGEKEELDEFEKIAKEKYGLKNAVRSDAHYLEVLPYNTSKGCQVEKICELYSIDINKTIALGDNMNDLDMISKCRYGFAVSNANPRLIQKARYTTVSNNESAIAAAINFVKNRI